MKIYYKNCSYKDLLENIKNESVDLLLTDPPYKVQGGKLWKGDIINKINEFEVPDFETWLSDVLIKLKEGAFCYIFINMTNLHKLLDAIKKNNFKILNILIWEKNTQTLFNFYSLKYEFIIFCKKNGRFNLPSINNCGTPNILKYSNDVNAKLHPTQKPINLLKFLIEQVYNPKIKDFTVFDPFAGVGTTGVACKMLDVNFYGSEIKEEYYLKGLGLLEAKQINYNFNIFNYFNLE